MSGWWLRKPMRMVQTNLREIDAQLDVDEYVNSLKEFSADVVLFNVGGIVANYPSKLPYHYVNPYLKDDLVGKVIERVKKEGIRFIARFDFSKVNKVLADKNPDWLYVSSKGEHIYYNGQAHTCVNGKYQQEYSLNMLEEVIRSYPVDGVFFNMIGYVTSDYSGNYHGICQCENCRRRFKELFGEDLPKEEMPDDPVYRKYENFKQITCKELFERIRSHVKQLNENIAICTYTHEGVDIYRKESNTVLSVPDWNYSASDNVKSVHGSWENMAVSNAAVHFIDYPFRHAAVLPNLNNIRLAQNLINGGWLDYYVIGTLHEQDDRVGLDAVKEIFKFHEENERYFTDIESIADVCLVMPEGSKYFGSMDEYKGIFRILSQNHVLFDVMHDSLLDNPNALTKLKKYGAVILPDVRNMSEDSARVIDRYVELGGCVLMTGETSTCNGQGTFMGTVALNSAGVTSVKRIIPKKDGCYFKVRESDKTALSGFEKLDIVYVHGDVVECELSAEARTYLGYIPYSMYGPPEKCYYTGVTDIPGIIENRFGMGKCVFIPWEIGRHYQRYSNHGHEMIIMSALNDLLRPRETLHTDASPLVEIAAHVQKEGKWGLIGLVNLSGQLGTAFLPPVPMRDIHIEFKTDLKPRTVYCLNNGQELKFEYAQGKIRFAIPYLSLFEVVVLK